MLHSFRFLRAQLMASGIAEPGVKLLSDFALSPIRTAGARAESLQQACKVLCQMHGLTIRSTGDFPTEPVIYVSNHLGYVDPLAICSLTPCSPIAKAEVGSWPILGSLARRLNVIFVQRDDVPSATRALRLARRRLEAGVSVLNFPEGTTTRGEMRQFRRGIFGLSALMRVPVVPLAVSLDAPDLCWVDDDSLLGHYSTTVIGRSHAIDVQVGPQMFMRASETPTELAARVRLWIASARRPHERRPASTALARALLRGPSWAGLAGAARMSSES